MKLKKEKKFQVADGNSRDLYVFSYYEVSGNYVLGDPGTLLDDENYKACLNQIKGLSNSAEIELSDGRQALVLFLGDDGLYADSQGQEYMVDSGLLALIPLSSVRPYALGDGKPPILSFSNEIVKVGRAYIRTSDFLLETTKSFYKLTHNFCSNLKIERV